MASDGFASPCFEHGSSSEVPATFKLKLMRYTLPKSFLRMGTAPAYANEATMTYALLDRSI